MKIEAWCARFGKKKAFPLSLDVICNIYFLQPLSSHVLEDFMVEWRLAGAHHYAQKWFSTTYCLNLAIWMNRRCKIIVCFIGVQDLMTWYIPIWHLISLLLVAILHYENQLETWNVREYTVQLTVHFHKTVHLRYDIKSLTLTSWGFSWKKLVDWLSKKLMLVVLVSRKLNKWIVKIRMYKSMCSLYASDLQKTSIFKVFDLYQF